MIAQNGGKWGSRHPSAIRRLIATAVGEPLQFRQRRIGRRYDYIWRRTDQFCRSGLYSVDITAPPVILDAQITAVDPAQPMQRVEERREASLTFAIGLRVGPHQRGDPSNSIRRLRARRERPRDGRATEQRDELAPFHC